MDCKMSLQTEEGVIEGKNGLPFFDEDEIRLRGQIAANITRGVERALIAQNTA